MFITNQGSEDNSQDHKGPEHQSLELFTLHVESSHKYWVAGGRSPSSMRWCRFQRSGLSNSRHFNWSLEFTWVLEQCSCKAEAISSTDECLPGSYLWKKIPEIRIASCIITWKTQVCVPGCAKKIRAYVSLIHARGSNSRAALTHASKRRIH